jgi:hypothetical protein
MWIGLIASLANDVGAELFGGDEISGIEAPLIARIWTPLDGPHNSQLQPADQWSAISRSADNAGDKRYAKLAEHIAFSLRAAGIRLRDASDHYRDQLLAAIEERRKPDLRFSNIPLSDLQLAFHSVLSELASARDYLAALLAYGLGAPARVDAMNRFAEWLSTSSRAEMWADPLVAAMLRAYDAAESDPWLSDLTDYRNKFLHRRPLGSSDGARWLKYGEYERGGLIYPFIEMPLSAGDPSAPGHDALLRFVHLYRRMTALLHDAVTHARYPATPPHFIAG